MDQTGLILVIFGFILGVYAIIFGIRMLFKRTSKSEAEIVKKSKERQEKNNINMFSITVGCNPVV